MQRNNRDVILKMRESAAALVKGMGGYMEQHDPMVINEVTDAIKSFDWDGYRQSKAVSAAAGNQFLAKNLSDKILYIVFPTKPRYNHDREACQIIADVTIGKHITMYMQGIIDEYVGLKRGLDLSVAKTIVDALCSKFNEYYRQKRARIVSDIIACFDLQSYKDMTDKDAAAMYFHMFLVNPIYEVCICTHPDKFEPYYRHCKIIATLLQAALLM